MDADWLRGVQISQNKQNSGKVFIIYLNTNEIALEELKAK
jgi:hypothetical protein